VSTLRVLHLEDSSDDAELTQRFVQSHFGPCDWVLARNAQEFVSALEREPIDLIISDSRVPGFAPREALELVKTQAPRLPFIYLSGAINPSEAAKGIDAGADDVISKQELWRLLPALKRAEARKTTIGQIHARAQTLSRIIEVVRSLSLCRSVEEIAKVVRRSARELVDAEGATFVLNEDGQCYYVDEDAVTPLWKGQRFPLNTCISGWVMQSKQQVCIPDIYADARIPHSAYRPTFVKSLVMTPIRQTAPVGAIGVYWAASKQASADELDILQALADTTSVAMENIQVYQNLERRVAERTAQLQTAMEEIQSFSYSVSHDLRAPLRAVRSFAAILNERCGDVLGAEGKSDLNRILKAGERMNALIEDLLRLAKITSTEVQPQWVNLSAMAQDILSDMHAQDSARTMDWALQPDVQAWGDPSLLRILLENLLNNAWKYTGGRERPHIEFGVRQDTEERNVYYIGDNGVGFDMCDASRLFAPFQRLHQASEFAGTGVGLATVQRVIAKHGGRIWAESAPDRGARFYFTLPETPTPTTYID
jgi:signal transduction histidine kinase/CheY-like chemotaxis protein